ncbi:Alpha/Beta hydrolase protein [Schizophyllum amplum]|uniref:Alpha/Beta hydrolase protein n=1 Tax=Schizophyllum amplum TaxID=97359 RepID=A0A550CBG9_9AGAR|nr:Alpha/Beta hydrolase protein [Auriculariopsis ampla]
MNSIFFPTQVAVLFKQVFRVFSGLAISNQYILHRQAGLNDGLALATADPSDFGGGWSPQDATEREKRSYVFRARWGRMVSFRPVENRRDERRASSSKVSDEDDKQGELPHGPSPSQPPRPPESDRKRRRTDVIHKLMANPALFDPLRRPRYPLVLCHGLYGFDTRGPNAFPSMRMHYWANVLQILREKLGAEVVVTAVPPTGSISSRAEALHLQLKDKVRGRGLNLLAHSMGGLDARHLISHIKPKEYSPLSLMSVSTPHRGSPFMDWCAEHIGLGKLNYKEEQLKQALRVAGLTEEQAIRQAEQSEGKDLKTAGGLSLSTFSTAVMSMLDSPAYANLTTTYLNNVFNPGTPDDPNVKYYSVSGRISSVNVLHPFWLPKMVVDEAEQKIRQQLRELWEKEHGKNASWDSDDVPLWAKDEEWGNDGLVAIQSAKWGEYLGCMEESDHWEMRGARGIEFGVDLPAIPAFGFGALRSSLTEADWSIKDWKRLIGTATREERDQRAAEAAAVAEGDHNKPQDGNEKAKAARAAERERQRASDDAVIASYTEKLSKVVDWLVEQVPTPPVMAIKEKFVDEAKDKAVAYFDRMRATEGADGKEAKGAKREQEKKRPRSDLETKEDMERFYIALTKKLYDDGL